MKIKRHKLVHFDLFIITLRKFGIKLAKIRCTPKSGKNWIGEIYSIPYYIVTPEDK